MKWGNKWGHIPSGARNFWGVLLNELADSADFTDSTKGDLAITCDTNYSVIPAFGSSALTSLWYPFVTPIIQVDLRNPKFGNNKQIDSSAIVRKNRGQELITFKDSTWPKFTSFKMSIEGLNTTDITNWKAFIQQVGAAGHPIGLKDYLNRTWRGFIVSNDTDIIQKDPNKCNYEISFEFLGVVQP